MVAGEAAVTGSGSHGRMGRGTAGGIARADGNTEELPDQTIVLLLLFLVVED
jgi:hypothetical protein